MEPERRNIKEEDPPVPLSWAARQCREAELRGACQLAADLGLATGHADDYAMLLEHCREQREETKREAQARAVEAAADAARHNDEVYDFEDTWGWVRDFADRIRSGEVTP